MYAYARCLYVLSGLFGGAMEKGAACLSGLWGKERRRHDRDAPISEPPNAHASQPQAVVRSALVVFKHGSVVFFNVEEALQSRYLHALARHCGEVVPQAHR